MEHTYVTATIPAEFAAMARAVVAHETTETVREILDTFRIMHSRSAPLTTRACDRNNDSSCSESGNNSVHSTSSERSKSSQRSQTSQTNQTSQGSQSKTGSDNSYSINWSSSPRHFRSIPTDNSSKIIQSQSHFQSQSQRTQQQAQWNRDDKYTHTFKRRKKNQNFQTIRNLQDQKDQKDPRNRQDGKISKEQMVVLAGHRSFLKAKQFQLLSMSTWTCSTIPMALNNLTLNNRNLGRFRGDLLRQSKRPRKRQHQGQPFDPSPGGYLLKHRYVGSVANSSLHLLIVSFAAAISFCCGGCHGFRHCGIEAFNTISTIGDRSTVRRNGVEALQKQASLTSLASKATATTATTITTHRSQGQGIQLLDDHNLENYHHSKYNGQQRTLVFDGFFDWLLGDDSSSHNNDSTNEAAAPTPPTTSTSAGYSSPHNTNRINDDDVIELNVVKPSRSPLTISPTTHYALNNYNNDTLVDSDDDNDDNDDNDDVSVGSRSSPTRSPLSVPPTQRTKTTAVPTFIPTIPNTGTLTRGLTGDSRGNPTYTVPVSTKRTSMPTPQHSFAAVNTTDDQHDNNDDNINGNIDATSSPPLADAVVVSFNPVFVDFTFNASSALPVITFQMGKLRHETSRHVLHFVRENFVLAADLVLNVSTDISDTTSKTTKGTGDLRFRSLGTATAARDGRVEKTYSITGTIAFDPRIFSHLGDDPENDTDDKNLVDSRFRQIINEIVRSSFRDIAAQFKYLKQLSTSDDPALQRILRIAYSPINANYNSTNTPKTTPADWNHHDNKDDYNGQNQDTSVKDNTTTTSTPTTLQTTQTKDALIDWGNFRDPVMLSICIAVVIITVGILIFIIMLLCHCFRRNRFHGKQNKLPVNYDKNDSVIGNKASKKKNSSISVRSSVGVAVKASNGTGPDENRHFGADINSEKPGINTTPRPLKINNMNNMTSTTLPPMPTDSIVIVQKKPNIMYTKRSVTVSSLSSVSFSNNSNTNIYSNSNSAGTFAYNQLPVGDNAVSDYFCNMYGDTIELYHQPTPVTESSHSRPSDERSQIEAIGVDDDYYCTVDEDVDYTTATELNYNKHDEEITVDHSVYSYLDLGSFVVGGGGQGIGISMGIDDDDPSSYSALLPLARENYDIQSDDQDDYIKDGVWSVAVMDDLQTIGGATTVATSVLQQLQQLETDVAESHSRKFHQTNAQHQKPPPQPRQQQSLLNNEFIDHNSKQHVTTQCDRSAPLATLKPRASPLSLSAEGYRKLQQKQKQQQEQQEEQQEQQEQQHQHQHQHQHQQLEARPPEIDAITKDDNDGCGRNPISIVQLSDQKGGIMSSKKRQQLEPSGIVMSTSTPTLFCPLEHHKKQSKQEQTNHELLSSHVCATAETKLPSSSSTRHTDETYILYPSTIFLHENKNRHIHETDTEHNVVALYTSNLMNNAIDSNSEMDCDSISTFGTVNRDITSGNISCHQFKTPSLITVTTQRSTTADISNRSCNRSNYFNKSDNDDIKNRSMDNNVSNDGHNDNNVGDVPPNTDANKIVGDFPVPILYQGDVDHENIIYKQQLPSFSACSICDDENHDDEISLLSTPGRLTTTAVSPVMTTKVAGVTKSQLNGKPNLQMESSPQSLLSGFSSSVDTTESCNNVEMGERIYHCNNFTRLADNWSNSDDETSCIDLTRRNLEDSLAGSYVSSKSRVRSSNLSNDEFLNKSVLLVTEEKQGQESTYSKININRCNEIDYGNKTQLLSAGTEMETCPLLTNLIVTLNGSMSKGSELDKEIFGKAADDMIEDVVDEIVENYEVSPNSMLKNSQSSPINSSSDVSSGTAQCPLEIIRATVAERRIEVSAARAFSSRRNSHHSRNRRGPSSLLSLSTNSTLRPVDEMEGSNDRTALRSTATIELSEGVLGMNNNVTNEKEYHEDENLLLSAMEDNSVVAEPVDFGQLSRALHPSQRPGSRFHKVMIGSDEISVCESLGTGYQDKSVSVEKKTEDDALFGGGCDVGGVMNVGEPDNFSEDKDDYDEDTNHDQSVTESDIQSIDGSLFSFRSKAVAESSAYVHSALTKVICDGTLDNECYTPEMSEANTIPFPKAYGAIGLNRTEVNQNTTVVVYSSAIVDGGDYIDSDDDDDLTSSVCSNGISNRKYDSGCRGTICSLPKTTAVETDDSDIYLV